MLIIISSDSKWSNPKLLRDCKIRNPQPINEIAANNTNIDHKMDSSFNTGSDATLICRV